jgi:PiT family inorganic phosphate transporter
VSNETYAALSVLTRQITTNLGGKQSFRDFNTDELKSMRKSLYLVGAGITKLDNQKLIQDPADDKRLMSYKGELTRVTQHIPFWVKVAVAMALGFGTMIGWKRIVVTVGEKIGKEHLTYAQGASAEIVAMLTIFAADHLGLPVSTTHVLSSGVAGTMAANRSGLQMNTLRNLLLAWIFTLPVCVLLGATTFSAGLFLIFTSETIRLVVIAALLGVAVAIGAFIRAKLLNSNRDRKEPLATTSTASSI